MNYFKKAKMFADKDEPGRKQTKPKTFNKPMKIKVRTCAIERALAVKELQWYDEDWFENDDDFETENIVY